MVNRYVKRGGILQVVDTKKVGKKSVVLAIWDKGGRSQFVVGYDFTKVSKEDGEPGWAQGFYTNNFNDALKKYNSYKEMKY